MGLFIHSCGDPNQPKATNIIPPVLVAPPAGQNVTQPFTFRWSGTADKLEIGYTPSFSNPVWSVTVAGNQYNMPPDTLANNGQLYYWRVGITSGSTVYWSYETWHFKTQ